MSSTFWSVYAAIYDRLWDNELWSAIVDAAAKALAADRGPRRIYEVGAGTGLTTRRLRDAGWEVLASEPNRAMLGRFRRRLPDVSCEPVDIAEFCDSSREPLDVVAVNVLHLVPDPGGALRELTRIAGPQGRVVVITPKPEASLLRAMSAQHRLGVSAPRILGFWLLHLILAPLAVACGVRIDEPRSDWEEDVPVISKETLPGGLELFTFAGNGGGGW